MRLPKCGPPARSLRLPLKEALWKCRSSGFTGALVFTSGYLNGTILFRAGSPVCAENSGLAGQQALREMESSTAMVRADLHTIPTDDIETIILFNESTKVGEGEEGGGAKTTIKPVKVGQNTRTASIRVIRADTAEDNDDSREQKRQKTGEPEKKQILNPSSIEALKKLSENFEASASDLLKEMNMEHLIVGDKKEEQ